MSFVAAMVAGFATASSGVPVPLVEPAVSSSVVILGLFVALAVDAPLWLGAATTGLFAFFHGHAHGAEAATAGLIPYASGFALATAALHVIGIALGFFAKSSIGKIALRAMGGLAAVSGLTLMVG
jgi:urease accessory protein